MIVEKCVTAFMEYSLIEARKFNLALSEVLGGTISVSACYPAKTSFNERRCSEAYLC